MTSGNQHIADLTAAYHAARGNGANSGPHADFPATGRAYRALKDRNLAISGFNRVLGRMWAPNMPWQMQFNNIGFCNLRCPMCMTHGTDESHAKYQQKSYTMTRDAMARIATEAFPHAIQCSTTGLGEGLLHSDLDTVIDHANRYGTRLFVNSNGTTLTSKHLPRLFGINQLQLSLDGALPHTFEAIRKGASYAKVMRAIRALKRTNALLPATLRMTPSINFVLCARNLRELPMMVDLAHYLGASSLFCFELISAFNHRLADEEIKHFPRLHRHCRDLAAARAAALGIEFNCPEPDPEISAGADAEPPIGDLAATSPDFAELIDEHGIEDEAVSLAGRALEYAIERHAAPGEADIRAAREHAAVLLASLEREFHARFAELSADEAALIRGARQSEATFLDCHFLHEALYFEANGDVRPCCMLTLRELAGDSRQQGVAEIFQGPTLAKFIADFRQGNLCDDCRACPVKQTVRMKDLFG